MFDGTVLVLDDPSEDTETDTDIGSLVFGRRLTGGSSAGPGFVISDFLFWEEPLNDEETMGLMIGEEKFSIFLCYHFT